MHGCGEAYNFTLSLSPVWVMAENQEEATIAVHVLIDKLKLLLFECDHALVDVKIEISESSDRL